MLVLSASYLCLVHCQVIFMAYHQLQCNNMSYLMRIMWQVILWYYFPKFILINLMQAFLCSSYNKPVISSWGSHWLPVESRDERFNNMLSKYYHQHVEIFDRYASYLSLVSCLVRNNKSWDMKTVHWNLQSWWKYCFNNITIIDQRFPTWRSRDPE